VVAGRRRASLHAAQMPWRCMRRRIHARCSNRRPTACPPAACTWGTPGTAAGPAPAGTGARIGGRVVYVSPNRSSMEVPCPLRFTRPRPHLRVPPSQRRPEHYFASRRCLLPMIHSRPPTSADCAMTPPSVTTNGFRRSSSSRRWMSPGARTARAAASTTHSHSSSRARSQRCTSPSSTGSPGRAWDTSA
jgi:hypothetical protein